MNIVIIFYFIMLLGK